MKRTRRTKEEDDDEKRKEDEEEGGGERTNNGGSTRRRKRRKIMREDIEGGEGEGRVNKMREQLVIMTKSMRKTGDMMLINDSACVK